jgi:hypothetical protein
MLLFAVRFNVVFGCMLGVLCRVGVVSVGQVRVVRRGFVVAIKMMLGGFAVVACSVLVVVRRVRVVMRCFVGHGISFRVLSVPRARPDYPQPNQEPGYRKGNSA